MLVLEPKVRGRVWGWTAALGLGCVALAVWYGAWAAHFGELPGGSSPPGLACGIAAFALFVFESLLALRKFPGVRTRLWLGTARLWLEVHIALGLFTLPLVLVHTRLLTHWGGPLTMVVALLFLGVYLSGIYGLCLQQWLPRRLLQTIPHETIRVQIPELSEHLRMEAELLILATCGPPESADGRAAAPVITDRHRTAIRAARKGAGAGLLRAMPATRVPGSAILWTVFRQDIEPFLRDPLMQSAIAGRGQSMERFRDWRSRVNEAAHETVDALERLCEQRRQLHEQERLHGRLHRWLWVHLLLSMSLLTATAWHAVVSVLYW